jgi:hypothetical protein
MKANQFPRGIIMKKIIALATALAAMLALCSCGHRHTVDTWSADHIGHWHICTECGEKTDHSAHDFGKNELCLVCNSSVVINGNGNTVVTMYDSEGAVIDEIVFDKDGNLIN